MLNPPVNGKIQVLFKDFECFSSTFQGKVNFQWLFKTVLYIQVLFKPVQTLYNVIMTHQLCFCSFLDSSGLGALNPRIIPMFHMSSEFCSLISAFTIRLME